MDVAVLGAAGDIGRAICAELIESRVLGSHSRLQLVGRAAGPSGRAVQGLRVDLIDAHDEHAPFIDVALRPEDVVADIVVVAAGRTVPTSPGQPIDRDALATSNLPMFEEYAQALAEHGSGHEVVIVVSNPVELGVAAFSRHLDRHRVIGMGAWLDSLRFRREIAWALGIRRQRVSGFVAGQHGDGAVPLWSTVRMRGLDADERAFFVQRLRGDRDLRVFADELVAARTAVAELAQDDLATAFEYVDGLRPGIRMIVRPFLTHQSGAKTAHGTARAAVELVDTVLDGREIVVAGQVALEGEISLGGSPWHGVLGVPIVVGPDGWTHVLLDELAPDEEEYLLQVAERIRGIVGRWLG
jgi:malate dehydrogenase